MKKLLLMLALLSMTSVAFTACGNTAEQEVVELEVPSDEVMEIEVTDEVMEVEVTDEVMEEEATEEVMEDAE